MLRSEGFLNLFRQPGGQHTLRIDEGSSIRSVILRGLRLGASLTWLSGVISRRNSMYSSLWNMVISSGAGRSGRRIWRGRREGGVGKCPVQRSRPERVRAPKLAESVQVHTTCPAA